ncbi:MAG TPA: glucose-6-phosphate dehydrogenase [Chloroflexota bacterium]|jgi:glucose-6-phosphate 1-dehydrogenase|nr:glucose-6-phosphate dehydrogenase [Chloroflexota bacterium]
MWIETLEPSPLREGLRLERTPEPCVMVIFGASGDLTRRKLMPALYNLSRERLIPAGFTVVGFARRPIGTDGFRAAMLDGINQFSRSRPVQPAVWETFARGIHYHQADFSDPDGFHRLRTLLETIDRERGTGGRRIFYLATPPSAYPEIVRQIGAAGLAQPSEPEGWARIIVEKPFGRDLATALELNRQIAEVFREDQVYRIDHYLGKETVQNILVFRFANGIFEPIWDRRYVDHVQITVSESIGMEGRARYYDETGALRDMVQNHLMQLLSLVAMEPPVAFDADAVRGEKVKVLRAIRPIPPSEVDRYVVRGQYGPGSVGAEDVPGYREEPGANPESRAETFVAMKLFIDNWRWADTPFYLRTGKRLPRRVSEIAIQFKRAPHLLFRRAAEDLEPNVLVLRIQPNEGISLRAAAKVPGPTIQIRSITMDFLYGLSFGEEQPEAYERLLLDCMLGDSTLFTRSDEVEAAWRLLTPMLEAWEEGPPPDFPNYAAGTWGPEAAHALIEEDGRRWRRP